MKSKNIDPSTAGILGSSAALVDLKCEIEIADGIVGHIQSPKGENSACLKHLNNEGSQINVKKKVVVFAPDCTDARVIKRMKAFKDNGFNALGISFRRRRYNQKYQPEWNNINLGMIMDRHYYGRLIALFRSLWLIFARKGEFVDANFFYAINLDQALLAFYTRMITWNNARIVYEVADIQPPFLRKNISGVILRLVERLVLKRIELLVVTSPGFIRNYFLPFQQFHSKWFLLENKLYPSKKLELKKTIFNSNYSKRNLGKPWVIGLFGVIKCSISWEILKHLASVFPESLEIHLGGYLTGLDKGEFFMAPSIFPNIRFGGDYVNPDDLSKMYSKIDFVWGFDFVNEDTNSRWLLPNRLYEGGCFGVPILTSKDFEVGNYVERLGIGWTFQEPYKCNLQKFFREITVGKYYEKKDNYQYIPLEQFVSKRQFKQICDMVTSDSDQQLNLHPG